MQQSRYLKTQLRQLVKGDFLYLDSDTLVCESLEEIDKTDAEIAMVSNGNGDLLREDSFQSEMSQIAGFGKQCGEPIFNGGVLFCRECVSATKLFESWHRFWLQSVKNGVSKDQPSLCYANSYCGHPIRELSGIWNCQLVSPSHKDYFDRSKVLHYWYSVKVESKIGIRLLLTQIKENGFVTKSVASVASNPRTIGYTSLTIDNDRALRFFFSELLYIYDSVHPLYRLCQRLSHLLLKPTQAISRWR